MDKKKTDQKQMVYDSDIDMWLDQFKIEQGIEDLRSISQAVWISALRYIQRHLFPDTSVFKSAKLTDNGCIPTTFNAYDYDLLLGVCNYYIYLCFLYDKEVSIFGFSCLTGVDNSIIYQWGAGYRGTLSQSSAEIYKNLMVAREESLSAKLATGKQNPVGVLSILNHFYSWNLPGVTREVARPALSADQLPKLGQNNNFCLPGTDKEINRSDESISGI